MPVKCGSSPTQTARDTDKGPIYAAKHAWRGALEQASNACRAEQCENQKKKCYYTEAKVTGSTWYSEKSKEWISDQTTSGKCSCLENVPNPCEREIEETVTAFGDKHADVGNKARTLAREIASQICEWGKCPDPPGVATTNKCAYKESKIVGTTWMDPESKKWCSKQTTTGTCACGEWF